jgi:hypothetical protein
MITPLRAMLVGAVLGIAAACAHPTAVCSCVLPPNDGLAYGIVRTAAGAPVAGAFVHAVAMAPGCAANTARVSPPGPQTAEDGTYELRFYSSSGGTEGCVRIVAHRAPLDSAFSQVDPFPYGVQNGQLIRQRVDITFP